MLRVFLNGDDPFQTHAGLHSTRALPLGDYQIVELDVVPVALSCARWVSLALAVENMCILYSENACCHMCIIEWSACFYMYIEMKCLFSICMLYNEVVALIRILYNEVLAGMEEG